MAMTVEELFQSILNESTRYNESHGMLSEAAEIKDSVVDIELTEEQLNQDIELSESTIKLIDELDSLMAEIEAKIAK